MVTKALEQVKGEFRTVYGTCCGGVYETEKMVWRSPLRLSLAEAIKCYGQMKETYNEFKPALLRRLLKAFPNHGIEVTPAREYSVAVYLHIPDVEGLRARVREWIEKNWGADEVHWMAPTSATGLVFAHSEGKTLRCWWD